MYKVVFDTVVFVRSLINPHGIWGNLIFDHNHQYHLFVSELMVMELLEVLHRKELAQKFTSLPNLNVENIIDMLGEANTVEISQSPAISRDPTDDKFLLTAVAASADYIVTEDADLLVLGTFNNIPIITAKEFLDILESDDE